MFLRFVVAGAILFGSTFGVKAFEWDVFSKLDDQARTCLLGYLDKSDLAALSSGERPGKKELRGKAKKASRACACAKHPPRYDGPMFDAMTQLEERDASGAMDRIIEAGVGKAALFARSRKYLGENEDMVFGLARDYPGLLVLGAPKYFLHTVDLGDEYVAATLKGVREKGYKFIGEILYTHGDKSHGERTAAGERYVSPLGEGTKALLNGLKKTPVPLMTHWEVYDWERDWPKFNELYKAWPDQVFIIPHMAFGSAEQITEILRAHPNVVATMSKKDTDKGGYADPAKAAKLGDGMMGRCGFLKDYWKEVLLAFPNRILFATDAHKGYRWARYGDYVESMRLILGQLPRDIAEAIAYRNAERVYGVSMQDR